jgi:hypothetical protein
MALHRFFVATLMLIAGAADASPMRAGVADEAPRPRKRTAPAGWAFSASPYVWASSVQADVMFGPLMSGVDVGAVSLARHSRYGAEAVLEARRGRFRITADVMYSTAAVGGSKEILSAMTNVNANVGTLLLDYASSYQLLGDDTTMLALEARSGIRYQRTTVKGDVDGNSLRTPEMVDAGADVVVGARAVVRPMPYVELVGTFDVGIGGVSESTSSKSIDATVRVAKNVSLTAGWRSLTMQRSLVTVSLSGPRAALQYQF